MFSFRGAGLIRRGFEDLGGRLRLPSTLRTPPDRESPAADWPSHCRDSADRPPSPNRNGSHSTLGCFGTSGLAVIAFLFRGRRSITCMPNIM